LAAHVKCEKHKNDEKIEYKNGEYLNVSYNE